MVFSLILWLIQNHHFELWKTSMLLASRNSSCRRPINSKLHYREAYLVISLATSARSAHSITAAALDGVSNLNLKRSRRHNHSMTSFTTLDDPLLLLVCVNTTSLFCSLYLPEVFSHIAASRKLMTASGCGGVRRGRRSRAWMPSPFLIETDLQAQSYFSQDSSILHINWFHELGLSAVLQTWVSPLIPDK